MEAIFSRLFLVERIALGHVRTLYSADVLDSPTKFRLNQYQIKLSYIAQDKYPGQQMRNHHPKQLDLAAGCNWHYDFARTDKRLRPCSNEGKDHMLRYPRDHIYLIQCMKIQRVKTPTLK